MTDEEMLQAAKALRVVASSVGSMHAYWDIIFDAEAIVNGKQSMLPRAAVEKMLAAELAKLKEATP